MFIIDFGIEFIFISYFSKNIFSDPGLSGYLNFLFGELSMWYMIIYKLRYI